MAKKKELKLLNLIEAGSSIAHVDEDRLHQVLYNLVGNAVKFTESGEIEITSSIYNSSPDEDENIDNGSKIPGKLLVSVSDTGIGIPKDKLHCIFESFEQLDGSASREYRGTGIGLSLTRQLVELHGGSIWVESTVGMGSKFLFTLPISYQEPAVKTFDKKLLPLTENEEPVETNMLLTSKSSSNKNGLLLIVDDDIINLQVAKNYLYKEYFVITAMNGEEALEQIEKINFDLVLVDIMMPRMSGYELCKRLREKYSFYDLPVIMLTARNNVSDLVAGFKAGANDYITKPVNRDELLSRIRNLIMLRKTTGQNKKAKFQLLQDRMNPHFLFNALNTIHALMVLDKERAERAVIKLAQNYHFLLEQSFRSVIEFEKEWGFVKNYLEFEEIRFKDRLKVQMEKRGDFADLLIPPLILQPIVENSLKHGLKNKTGEWLIQIFAEKKGKDVVIEVLDNGIGLKDGDVFSRTLKNIRDRMSLQFDDAEFQIKNKENGGVRVSMILTEKTKGEITLNHP